MGTAVMTHLGLPQFVAESADRFVQIAALHAADPARVEELRRTLWQRLAQSALMDAERFCLGLELCYRRMWRAWCESVL
jgi:predicted O-linked N-acetylglucosamine transferase (SPINDLY family)